MSDEPADDVRARLLVAARERLRAHLAAEADGRAGDDADADAIAEVQAFVNRLGGAV